MMHFVIVAYTYWLCLTPPAVLQIINSYVLVLEFFENEKRSVFGTSFAMALKSSLKIKLASLRTIYSKLEEQQLALRNGAHAQRTLGSWLSNDEVGHAYHGIFVALKELRTHLLDVNAAIKFQDLLVSAIFLGTGGQRSEFLGMMTIKNIMYSSSDNVYTYVPGPEKRSRVNSTTFVFPSEFTPYICGWIMIG